MSTTPRHAQRADQAMSDSREVRNPMGQPRGSASKFPAKSLRLSRQEAANCLECVGRWLRDGHRSPELESLRNALEDACWLARWKREAVILDLCPSVLPGILETLVQIHSDEPSAEAAEALETVIRELSVS